MPTSFQSFNPGDLIEDTHVEQYIEPIQNLETGKSWYGEADGASVDDLEVALDPAPSAYTAGMLVHLKSNSTVTGPATLNVNGLGIKPLLKEGNVSLNSGDIINGQVVSAIYDGANFQLLSPPLLPTTSSPVSQNSLVYSEVGRRITTASISTVSLPNFNFNPLKKYLLKIEAGGHLSVGAAGLRVVFSDGATSHSYPGAATIAQFKNSESPSVFTRILPNLSGSHSLTIQGLYVGTATISLYEINDNLVYADFTPRLTTSLTTEVTLNLSDFVAVSGHTYEMKVTGLIYGGAASISCYLTDTINVHGIPYSDPLVDFVDGPPNGSDWTMTKVLTGLSGTYQVKARGRACNGVCVEIRDIS